jgi:hypothetical protein
VSRYASIKEAKQVVINGIERDHLNLGLPTDLKRYNLAKLWRTLDITGDRRYGYYFDAMYNESDYVAALESSLRSAPKNWVYMPLHSDGMQEAVAADFAILKREQPGIANLGGVSLHLASLGFNRGDSYVVTHTVIDNGRRSRRCVDAQSALSAYAMTQGWSFTPLVWKLI